MGLKGSGWTDFDFTFKVSGQYHHPIFSTANPSVWSPLCLVPRTGAGSLEQLKCQYPSLVPLAARSLHCQHLSLSAGTVPEREGV